MMNAINNPGPAPLAKVAKSPRSWAKPAGNLPRVGGTDKGALVPSQHGKPILQGATRLGRLTSATYAMGEQAILNGMYKPRACA